MASLIGLIFSLMRSVRTARGMPLALFSFQMISNSLVGVVPDEFDDLVDIFPPELGDAAVPDAHQLVEFLVGQGQAGQDLERRGRDAALVGRGVLVEDDALFFEPQAGLLGDEEVRAFDDHLEAGLAVVVDVGRPVVDRDRGRPAAAGDEDVGLEERVEMERVPELEAVLDLLAVGQRDVAVLDVDQEAAGRELRLSGSARPSSGPWPAS